MQRYRELCQLAGTWRGDVPAHGTWVEPKVDGVRALWIDGRLVTREGMDLHGVGHIAAALRRLEAQAGVPMVFDGELLVGGAFGATLSHIATKGARDAGTLHLFDCLPLADWRAGGTSEPLFARKARLIDLHKRAEAAWAADPLSWECQPVAGAPDATPLAIVPDSWATDRAHVEAIAAGIWAAGGEGCMLKDAEAGYCRARSNDWRKVKRSLVLRLPVVAVICRDDAPGRAVALACDLEGRRVRVPLQASIAERDRIWRSQGHIIGEMALVGAMERTAKGALRQPRFIGMAA